MITADLVQEKIQEIILELQVHGLLKKQMPRWVMDFSNREIINEEDFAGWLQFVFLPNLKQQGIMAGCIKMIAPQAIKFFGNDVRKGKLLQLLVELDSLI